MLFLTCDLQSNGRSGHKFTQLFTLFLCSELVKALTHDKTFTIALLYHPSWSQQHIISPQRLQHATRTAKPSKHAVHRRLGLQKWHALHTLADFKTILYNPLLTFANKEQDVIVWVTTKGNAGCSIMPHTPLSWGRPVLQNVARQTLTRLRTWYGLPPHTRPKNAYIAIHIRRGDLTECLNQVGLTPAYYTVLMKRLHRHYPTLPIRVYCENKRWKALASLPHCTLHVGGPNTLQRHIREMAQSALLFVSPSSMAVFTGYLHHAQRVFVDRTACTFRPNMLKACGVCFTVFAHDLSTLDTLLPELV